MAETKTAMPAKLKVLLGLLAVAISFNLLGAVLAGSVSSMISLGVNMLLLVGVLRGKEGARNILIGLAILGLAFGGFFLIIGVIALSTGRPQDIVEGTVVVLSSGFVLFQCGFFIWCLRQRDVQHWMFQKSMGDVAP